MTTASQQISIIGAVSEARLAADAALVETWLRTYISRSHQELGRPGAICPFVPPALKLGLIQFAYVYDVPLLDRSSLFDLLHAEMDTLSKSAENMTARGASLAARLVVLPLSGPRDWALVDAEYERMKDLAIGQGLMVGQFHPDCEERAVRNSGFAVSKSPLGLIALRLMAVHDILFLGTEPARFRSYQTHFAADFDAGRVADARLVGLYRAACDAFGAGYRPAARSDSRRTQ